MKCLNCGKNLIFRRIKTITVTGSFDDNGNLVDDVEKSDTNCLVHCNNCGFDAEYGFFRKCCFNCSCLVSDAITKKHTCINQRGYDPEEDSEVTKQIVHPLAHVCQYWRNGVESKTILL